MQTKQCTKCRKDKNVDQFSKRSSAPDGLQHQCKMCCTANCRKHYLENREVYLTKNGISKTLIRKRLREEYIELKKT